MAEHDPDQFLPDRDREITLNVKKPHDPGIVRHYRYSPVLAGALEDTGRICISMQPVLPPRN